MGSFHLTDWGVGLGLVAALLAGLLYLIRAEVLRSHKKLIDEVQERTRQIQPHSNGGKSLTDLHKKVDAFGVALSTHVIESEAVKHDIEAKVSDIHERQQTVIADLLEVKATVKDLGTEVDGIGRRRKRGNHVDG